MGSQTDISVVIPVYRAEKIIDELVARLNAVLKPLGLNYEIVLVDDRSPDDGWNKILNICQKDPNIKAVRLARNFGQHYAITAGLANASGDYIITMDCDLQDDPLYIPGLLAKIKEGADIVFTTKKRTGHNFLKNITATFFFQILNWLSETSAKATGEVGGYLIMKRNVKDAFLSVHDTHRHYLMILRWLGFKSEYLSIEHRPRFEGKSSYTFFKLLKHALNGITSQSVKLLNLSVILGFIIFAISVLGGLYFIYGYFTHGSLKGWTSLFVLVLFSTGLILMSIGVLGIYLGKTFEQSKNRPLYIVDSRLNF